MQVCKSIVQGKYGELWKGMNHLVKILAFRDIHRVEKKNVKGVGNWWNRTLHTTSVWKRACAAGFSEQANGDRVL